MNSDHKNANGFIQIILLLVIGLIVLGYFGFNLKEILTSPVVKENLTYAWELTKTVWSNWLQEPALWVFEHIIKVLWDLFLEGLAGLKDTASQ